MRLMELIAAFLCIVNSVYASDSKSWKLLHSLDNGKSFTARATVDLGLNDEGEVEIKIENNADCLSLDALEDLKGLYQVKLIDDESKTTVISSVPACEVKRSNFRDDILITLDAKAFPLSLSYTPLVSPLAPICAELPSLTEVPSFTSKIGFEVATPAMTIPTILPPTKPQAGLKFFPRSMGTQKVPGVDKEGEDGSKPQSLLMRYWYVILPLFIVGMMGSQEEQPAEQTAAAGGAAVGAAAAATAGGGGTRRGKRG